MSQSVCITFNAAVTAALAGKRGENTVANFFGWKRRESMFPAFVGRNRVIDRNKEFACPIVRNADGTAFIVVSPEQQDKWSVECQEGTFNIFDLTLNRWMIVPATYKAAPKTEAAGSGLIEGFEVTVTVATDDDNTAVAGVVAAATEAAAKTAAAPAADGTAPKKCGRRTKEEIAAAAAAAAAAVIPATETVAPTVEVTSETVVETPTEGVSTETEVVAVAE